MFFGTANANSNDCKCGRRCRLHLVPHTLCSQLESIRLCLVQVPPMAAKTLVMLGLNDSEVNRRVERYVLTPIMDMVCILRSLWYRSRQERALQSETASRVSPLGSCVF
jgi:hypothetical protein